MSDVHDFDHAAAESELFHHEDGHEHAHPEEFGPGDNRAGAREAIIAKHLDDKYRGKKHAPLSKSWFQSMRPRPLQHIKNNWKTMAMTTVAGGALAYGGALALNTAFGNSASPDLIAVAKTAALSYPAWGILSGVGERLGFYYGHFLNAANKDRFREVKTAPSGKWIGRSMAVGLAVAGGIYGHTYLDTIGDVTVRAPYTITQSIPSAFVDTFTDQSNTKWDMVWELKDQPGCKFLEQVDPSHICKDGPGGDTFEVKITDPEGLEAVTPDASIGAVENLVKNEWKLGEYVPEIPSWMRMGTGSSTPAVAPQ